MTKLVFLDIDCVLDTYKSRYQLDPELMAHLGTLLEKTGASIVISSSWRAQDVPGTVEFMTDSDNPSVGGHPFPFTDKIVGVTPILFSVIDGDIVTARQPVERKSQRTLGRIPVTTTSFWTIVMRCFATNGRTLFLSMTRWDLRRLM